MVLALPIGCLAARHPGRLSALTERAAYLAHALPGVVVGLSLVFLGVTVADPLYQTTWLLAFAYAALFLPLAVAAGDRPPRRRPRRRSRRSARRWAAAPPQVFRSVTLPLTLPGIGAGAALVFLTCMKELPATLMLRPTGMDTLATELWQATSYQRYAAAAPYASLLVLLATIPTWALVRRSGVVTTTRTRTPARILDEELIIA